MTESKGEPPQKNLEEMRRNLLRKKKLGPVKRRSGLESTLKTSQIRKQQENEGAPQQQSHSVADQHSERQRKQAELANEEGQCKKMNGQTIDKQPGVLHASEEQSLGKADQQAADAHALRTLREAQISEKRDIRHPQSLSVNTVGASIEQAQNGDRSKEIRSVKVIVRNIDKIKQSVADLSYCLRGLEYIQKRVKHDRKYRCMIKNKLSTLKELYQM